MKIKVWILFFICAYSGNVFSLDYFYLYKQNGDKIKVTLKDLERLPEHSFITGTSYTLIETFTGVNFTDVAEHYHIKAPTVRVFAWDNYSYTMPVDELKKYNVLIAYKRNGTYMTLETLGPFAIVYPRDSITHLDGLDINAKTVWQTKIIEEK